MRTLSPWLAGVVTCLGLALAPARAEPLPGFKLDGARWTYQDEQLKMQGGFLKPEGNGPFPAIVISHGLGGGPDGFSMPKAREFVKWGFVCIAPEYTHAKGGDDRKTFGASPDNLRRATKCLDILASLPYVDQKRICAYGNSMGAFVTIGLAATAPDRLAAAAITAGGVAPKAGFPAPATEEAAKVRTPFCILHGTTDTTVRPEMSATFKEVLDKNKVPSVRTVFEGVGHNLHQEKAKEVYQHLQDWFRKQGVLKP